MAGYSLIDLHHFLNDPISTYSFLELSGCLAILCFIDLQCIACTHRSIPFTLLSAYLPYVGAVPPLPNNVLNYLILLPIGPCIFNHILLILYSHLFSIFYAELKSVDYDPH